jgi:hypothetical protein
LESLRSPVFENSSDGATPPTVNSERAQEDRADKGEHREHRHHVELQGKVHVAFSASFWDARL